ncbi:TetR/AcrR family transcriptional regulator [Negativibacillus massiliensis]|uniref:TetR/AcrR family transcriptional regulator n=1 Tax=Negativibacillus massiliensis TaxID=1871035 RepID=UPI003AF7917A
MEPKKAFKRLPDEKKQDFIDKAIDLFLSVPYEDITMRMLNKALSINSATFYRYFDSKDALYLYIYHTIAEKLPKSEGYNLWEAPLSNMITYAPYISMREKNFLSLIYKIPDHVLQMLLDLYRDEEFDKFKEYLTLDKRKGKLREDIDIDFLIWLLFTIRNQLYIYVRQQGYSVDEIFRLLNFVFRDLLRNGIYKHDS